MRNAKDPARTVYRAERAPKTKTQKNQKPRRLRPAAPAKPKATKAPAPAPAKPAQPAPADPAAQPDALPDPPPPPKESAVGKLLRLRPRLAAALCAVSIALCVALPAVFQHLTDLAVWGRSSAVADPYTPPTPSGDDFYILRQLSARSEAQAQQSQASTGTQPGADSQAPGAAARPSLYVSTNAYSPEQMSDGSGYTDTLLDLLDDLAEQGAVPKGWVQAARSEILGGQWDYNEWMYPFYAVDSLGFITLKYFTNASAYGASCNDNSYYALMSVTLDSRTGQPVEVWLSADVRALAAQAGTAPVEVPADEAEASATDAVAALQQTIQDGKAADLSPKNDALRALIDRLGLDTLGDWAVPSSTAYTHALYSQNGQALVSAGTNTYTITYFDTDSQQEETLTRMYYLLSLSSVAADDLPYTVADTVG